VVLTGMSLTKEHPEIALGEVYTVSVDNKKEIFELPCLPSNKGRYCYQLTKDRNSRDYLLVDFRIENN
jgi:hypothetical protein